MRAYMRKWFIRLRKGLYLVHWRGSFESILQIKSFSGLFRPQDLWKTLSSPEMGAGTPKDFAEGKLIISRYHIVYQVHLDTVPDQL